MSGATLLLEIGCEEMPARMIPAAAAELSRRVLELLDRAELTHGDAASWGGSRRLAVRVDDVPGRQRDRDETVTGPPAKIGWGESGPTPAARGFASKQGVDPEQLSLIENERGTYVGFTRRLTGRTVGEVLAAELPRAVESMPFPKTMRWSDGSMRWVRPVHWLLALHGSDVLPVSLFGIEASAGSRGHRFRSSGRVPVATPDAYASALEAAGVVVDPAERRRRIAAQLSARAANLSGAPVGDPSLLEEVSYLVEWPGVVEGTFDSRYLELPAELLTTTLRHHQKCFSVVGDDGRLRAAFLAVANTDVDPAGHIRRGNEWVVSGRLEDARFFWAEDRKRALGSRVAALDRVVFHARAGTFGDKASRMERLAGALARHLGLGDAERHAAQAARLAKADLTTSTVGEFPELQGRIGGLLLRAEGEPEEVAAAVYSHYQPVGPDDAIPPTEVGCVVAVADKLDTVASLLAAGEKPKGSKDPFGLRRAMGGIFRIALEREWPLSLNDLTALAGDAGERLLEPLERGQGNFFRDRGAAPTELLAVMRPRLDAAASRSWPIHDVASRLDAIGQVRGRDDFRNLVKLTQRVNNILTKESDRLAAIRARAAAEGDYREEAAAAGELAELLERAAPRMSAASERRDYPEVVEAIAGFVAPVERFFDEVLVVDEERPGATASRLDLMHSLRALLTRYFDIRELAGQAERSS
jgi:glycyl-tRNA synthetase beta chain